MCTTIATYTTSRCTFARLQHTFETPETLKTYVCNMLFHRKHLLVASQMEAHRRVEVTGVLADNAKLGGGAQKAGVGAARVRGAHRGRVVGAWRSPMCSLEARSSPVTRSWVAQHRVSGGGGTGGDDAEGGWRVSASHTPSTATDISRLMRATSWCLLVFTSSYA